MTKQGDLENFDKIIANINLEIAKKIDNNLDRLIEAFTIYYGIDKRKQIEYAIKNTYFVWYIDKDLDVIHDLLMDSSIVSRTTITYEILKMLNIKINKLDIDCDFKNISSIGRKNILNNGKVYSALVNQGVDISKLLKCFFGNKIIFDYDYSKIPIYNYFKLEENEREKLRKILQNFIADDEINDIVYEVINYMNSLLSNLDKEKSYIKIEQLYQYNKDNLKVLPTIARSLKLKRPYQILGSYPKYFLNIRNNSCYDVIMNQLKNQGLAFCYDDGDVSLIVFPALGINDKFLIHEINHRIKSNILAYNDDEVISLSGVSLSVGYNSQNEGIEEVINDLQAEEITNIFHNLGDRVFDSFRDYDIKVQELYLSLHLLVYDFYKKYKDNLKEVGFNGNLNNLFKYVSKDKYYEYCDFINEIFNRLIKERENFILSSLDISNNSKLLKDIFKCSNEDEINIYDFYDIVGYRKNIPIVRERKRK